VDEHPVGQLEFESLPFSTLTKPPGTNGWLPEGRGSREIHRKSSAQCQHTTWIW
jgi:hypothetical protein